MPYTSPLHTCSSQHQTYFLWEALVHAAINARWLFTRTFTPLCIARYSLWVNWRSWRDPKMQNMGFGLGLPQLRVRRSKSGGSLSWEYGALQVGAPSVESTALYKWGLPQLRVRLSTSGGSLSWEYGALQVGAPSVESTALYKWGLPQLRVRRSTSGGLPQLRVRRSTSGGSLSWEYGALQVGLYWC